MNTTPIGYTMRGLCDADVSFLYLDVQDPCVDGGCGQWRTVMPNALELRVTHKYVGTYQHEDEWKTLGEYEVLSSQKWKPVEDEEGEYDITDPIKHYYEVAVIPYGAEYKAEEIHQALKDSFTQVGCHHEYDCCGCRSFYASKPEFLYQEEDGLHYRIVVNSYRNY